MVGGIVAVRCVRQIVQAIQQAIQQALQHKIVTCTFQLKCATVGCVRQAAVGSSLCASGWCKNSKGGPLKGEEAVIKIFKSGDVFETTTV